MIFCKRCTGLARYHLGDDSQDAVIVFLPPVLHGGRGTCAKTRDHLMREDLLLRLQDASCRSAPCDPRLVVTSRPK